VDHHQSLHIVCCQFEAKLTDLPRLPFCIPPPCQTHTYLATSPCVADPSSFTYIRDHTYDSRVSPPKPPKLLLEGSKAAEAAAAAMRAAAASGSNDGCGPYVQGPLWNKSAVIVTEEEEGDEEEGPHRLLARLNGGHLPWTSIKDGEKVCRLGVRVWGRVGAGGGGGAYMG